jgi:hypothetical protein
MAGGPRGGPAQRVVVLGDEGTVAEGVCGLV